MLIFYHSTHEKKPNGELKHQKEIFLMNGNPGWLFHGISEITIIFISNIEWDSIDGNKINLRLYNEEKQELATLQLIFSPCIIGEVKITQPGVEKDSIIITLKSIGNQRKY